MIVHRLGGLWPMLVLGLGCGGTPSLNNQVVVQGLVTDGETGEPLVGARVQTTPATESVRTDATGAFTFTAQLGVRYQVQAAQDGFEVASQTFTPRVGQDNRLQFDLALVRICIPDSRRCVQGDEAAGVEVCAARGNLWALQPCADKQACDPADGTCRDLSNLFVILDAPGGIIRSQPVDGQPSAIIRCGTDCSADFFTGTAVTLVATPLAQAGFTGWRGMMCTGTDPVCVVTLNQDERVGGGFSANAFGLTVNKVGRGTGRINSQPAGINCGGMCSAVFDRDQMVTLTAAPGTGSVFVRWEDDCSAGGAGPTCTLTMDANKTATARFAPEGITLEVSTLGTGAGQVSSMPAGIDCGATCLSTFNPGTQVTLTATPQAGSTFTGWGGDCSGTDPTCVLTTDAPQTVTATFDGIAHTVTVEKGGAGTGRVVSAPAGIDCGAACQSNFADGTQVVLTATPDPYSVFSGWELDCLSAGADPACTVSADADRRARANFEPLYLAPLQEDAACAFILHLDTSAPDTVGCGTPGTAQIAGNYAATPSRVAALAEARLAQGADEEGYIDVGRPLPPPGPATLELTLRKDGPAFGARGRAVLVSDQDFLDPSTHGLRLLVLDDGRLVVSTRDAVGATHTATSAGATIGDGTWYHVAATVDPAGLALFVDGVEVVRAAGPLIWTASSSTAWVGAEREGPGGQAIHRFNGAMDEVRVSDVVRY